MNELIFNGKNFTEFNAYYATSNFLDGAAKDVQSVSVVGRSGDLQLSNNRYKNLSLKIRVYVTRDMEASMRAMRNYLESVHGYARVEISDQPNEFRMAAYKEMFAPDSYDSKVGVVDLTFDSMPQRFLKSGETTTSVSSSSSEISGNPVSISNPSGLTSLTGLSVDIQPVQDLNGYDAPWVGGAGKNLFPNNATNETKTANGITIKAENGVYTIIGTATASTDISFTLAESVDMSPSTNKICFLNNNANTKVALYFRRNGENVHCWEMNSANRVASGWTQTADETVNTLRFYIGSGGAIDMVVSPMLVKLADENPTVFEPYSNICPITGHTSVTVQRTGKNLLNQSDFVNGSINGNTGANLTSTTRLRSPFVMVESGKKYSVQCNSELLIFEMHRYDASKNWLGYTLANQVSRTFTVDSDTRYMKFLVRKSDNANIEVNELTAFQFEEGNATEYEPYQGQTVTVDLNGTVYGGTLDVLTGVLTVTHVYKAFTSADSLGANHYAPIWRLNWNGATSDAKAPSSTAVTNIMSNCFKAVPEAQRGQAGTCFISGVSKWIQFDISDTGISTANEAKAYFFSLNPVIVYELATPTTVQLTAQQVSLLTGTNIISTDMNGLTVTIASPAELENPTVFESKPIIRVYGNGTLNVNDIYITVANSPYTYIDIDCELMDCYHGSNNANQYVSFSTTDYVTLRSGMNYFSYSGFTKVEVTPRWYEI